MKIKNIKSIAFIKNLTKAYTEGIYADTPANRKLGRVGMSYKEWTQKQQGQKNTLDNNKNNTLKKEESPIENKINKLVKIGIPKELLSTKKNENGDWEISIDEERANTYYTEGHSRGDKDTDYLDKQEELDRNVAALFGRNRRGLGTIIVKKEEKEEKPQNEERDFTSSQYSEKTNSLIKEMTPYFEETPKEIIEELGSRLSYMKNEKNANAKLKYCLKQQGGTFDQGGVIFTDGKGNFWDIRNPNRNSGASLRKLTEGITKNWLRPSLQDSLKEVGNNSTKYLDKILSEGKGKEWIEKRLSSYNSGKLYKGNLPYDTSLSYMNKQQNAKEWNNVLNEIENLDEKTKENFGINVSKTYLGNRQNLHISYSLPNSKESELGEYNTQDLNELKNILGKIKGRSEEQNPFKQ